MPLAYDYWGKGTVTRWQFHLKFWIDFLKDRCGQRFVQSDQIPTFSPSELERLDYYFKRNLVRDLSHCSKASFSYSLLKRSAYSYDFWRMAHRVSDSAQLPFRFGDIREVPGGLAFVKSRPIKEGNQNSILLPLNTVRHFDFIADKHHFTGKLNRAVWRGACYKPWRQRFVARYFDSDLVDAADTAPKKTDVRYRGRRMSRSEQLRYKFIISIEGNDVASNLKWAMLSNSVVVMAVPKFETWFCEGRLIPGEHFICVDDDYENVEQVVSNYITKPEECARIIRNANMYASQFLDLDRQFKLGREVVRRYVELIKGGVIES